MSGHNGRQIGRVAFYATAVGVLVLDQVSKAIARSTLDIGHRIEIVPGLFWLKLVANPGAAFGTLSSWPAILVLIGIAAVAAIIGLRKERSRSRALAVSLGLLLGGSVGNLIDRIFLGHVTDFLDLGITVRGRFVSWPTFNLADVAITFGVILLAYHLLFWSEERELRVES